MHFESLLDICTFSCMLPLVNKGITATHQDINPYNQFKLLCILFVRILLENGADPGKRDKKAMTAYDFAADKDTRNVFRRFMGEYPDKYNYSKSGIALSLLVKQYCIPLQCKTDLLDQYNLNIIK